MAILLELKIDLAEKSYPIIIEKGLINSIQYKIKEIYKGKKIFILSKRQNYTNKEIAEMMGISESTVATQLSLAVKFMREQLMKHYDKVIALLIAFFVNEM